MKLSDHMVQNSGYTWSEHQYLSKPHYSTQGFLTTDMIFFSPPVPAQGLLRFLLKTSDTILYRIYKN